MRLSEGIEERAIFREIEKKGEEERQRSLALDGCLHLVKEEFTF